MPERFRMKSSGWKYSLEPEAQKYLVICDGGNVRSAALATTLKLDYGQEAICIGRLFTSPDTMDMLSDWADKIVLMQPHMQESVPIRNWSKVFVTDIGQDRWGIYIHPELNQLTDEKAEFLINEPKARE